MMDIRNTIEGGSNFRYAWGFTEVATEIDHPEGCGRLWRLLRQLPENWEQTFDEHGTLEVAIHQEVSYLLTTNSNFRINFMPFLHIYRKFA